MTANDVRRQVVEAFKDADLDGNGIIDREELQSLIKKLAIPLKDPIMDTDFIFDTLDTDQNNECSFKEFSDFLEPYIVKFEVKGFPMDVSFLPIFFLPT